MSEFRFDPIRGEWIVIAADRGERGDYFIKDDFIDPLTERNCPFCPENRFLLTKIIYEKDDLLVIPNKHPLFMVEKRDTSFGVGPYDFAETMGAHEVIIDCAKHKLTFSEYTDKVLKNLLLTVKERYLDLKNDKRIKYISFFKNYGFNAGATLLHPHSQIAAMFIIPSSIETELKNTSDFYKSKDRCLFCDIINFESNSRRFLFENEHFISFAPYASKYPFEMHIYPKKHSADYFHITDKEIDDLTKIMKDTFSKMYERLGHIPFNLVLKSAPVNLNSLKYAEYEYVNEFYHYHFEIIPRINKYGSLECGYGLFINPVEPERAVFILKGEI